EASLRTLEPLATRARWVFRRALESDRHIRINGFDALQAALAAYWGAHGGRRAGKNAAALAGEAAQAAEILAQAQTIRDVVGNPFRRTPAIDPVWLAWSNGVVVEMARAAYEAKDFACLPVLADALEDAGCADEAILSHLRSMGPHVRGCWAIDLLLDKR